MPATFPRIESASLDVSISGRNLRPGPLRDQLDEQGTMVVFLRHLGCPFSRESLAELREQAVKQSLPPILYIHPATLVEGDRFFERFAPESRAIADPSCSLYEAFGVGRGGLGQLLSPAVIACAFRASFKGHGGGRPQGDIWRMPGFFLVRDGEIVWEYRARHAGDHPNFSRLTTELAPFL